MLMRIIHDFYYFFVLFKTFYDLKRTQKVVFASKNCLTSERRAEHPFSGRNIQQKGLDSNFLARLGLESTKAELFFKGLVLSSEETSFMTTFYGLYFNQHYTHI